jgi:hypothetical protein
MIAIFYSLSPDPVSPFLLRYAFEGNVALQYQQFMEAVAPLTARLFSFWPTDDSTLWATPKIHRLLANLDLQMSFQIAIWC